MDWRGRAGGLWTYRHIFCRSTDRAGTKREEARMSLCSCEEREGCAKPPVNAAVTLMKLLFVYMRHNMMNAYKEAFGHLC